MRLADAQADLRLLLFAFGINKFSHDVAHIIIMHFHCMLLLILVVLKFINGDI